MLGWVEMWKKIRHRGGEEENGGGEHGAPKFVYRVHHAPYFIGCIVELTSIIKYEFACLTEVELPHLIKECHLHP